MEALDATIIVPGQGPELRDKEYLRHTIALFEAIISQVHAALEGGAVTVSEVRERVKLDAIQDRFTAGDPELGRAFKQVTDRLIEKVYQEAHDGVVRG
jgi:hypothetical protein